MKFFSTNQKNNLVGLEEAVLNGLASDGGLYLPCSVPSLSQDFFSSEQSENFQEIAFNAAKLFFVPDLPEKTLRTIIEKSYDFPIPLVALEENLFVLELFHGPTCAFKDFAARFMARLFGFFAEKSNQEITILTATSGDTGSAVAHGFLNVAGIKVVILYPSGKVSPLQEKQLTGMGRNITALEVLGTFDDCQTMAKQAFLDVEIRKKLKLASANSINIARLLPQSFYYLYLCKQLQNKLPLAVSVPSGNFGNLTAGVIAKKMGAPLAKMIASTNQNDIIPHYLATGNFLPKPSVATISNAMDVGNPSNFARLLELYENNWDKMRQDLCGISFSDQVTREVMQNVFQKYAYILDPHGAVAYLGLVDFMRKFKGYTGVFLETAHPAKFLETVEAVIQKPVAIPTQLQTYLKREKKAVLLKNDFQEFKNWLLSLQKNS